MQSELLTCSVRSSDSTSLPLLLLDFVSPLLVSIKEENQGLVSFYKLTHLKRKGANTSLCSLQSAGLTGPCPKSIHCQGEV